jgi:hypothetical protein
MGLPIGTFSLVLGLSWTPAFLSYEKPSKIYVLNDKSGSVTAPIEGRVLFSLTEFLIVLRSDDVFVVIPSVASVIHRGAPIAVTERIG